MAVIRGSGLTVPYEGLSHLPSRSPFESASEFDIAHDPAYDRVSIADSTVPVKLPFCRRT
jgi:hypothetical protein